jgi:thiamine pyrophosphate-dependent acetolactate synthase large subunit-like protein
MGGHGEYVEHPDQIAPAIQRSLDSGLPACVNVMIDREVNPGA